MAADKGPGFTGSRRAGTGRVRVVRGANYTKGPGISSTTVANKGRGPGPAAFKKPSPGKSY